MEKEINKFHKSWKIFKNYCTKKGYKIKVVGDYSYQRSF